MYALLNSREVEIARLFIPNTVRAILGARNLEARLEALLHGALPEIFHNGIAIQKLKSLRAGRTTNNTCGAFFDNNHTCTCASTVPSKIRLNYPLVSV